MASVLRDVTNHKIARLVKQQSQFEDSKASVLTQAKGRPDALPILIDGLKKLGLDGQGTDASLLNAHLFQEQAKRDASIPPALVQEWEKELLLAFDAKSRKYEFAALFSKLATEWADNPNEANVLLQTASSESDTSVSSADSDDFETVGREEMHRQRQEWESHVFTERKTDADAITRHLLDLFTNISKSKRAGKTPLDGLRSHMKSFGVDEHGRPAPQRCFEEDVRLCVKAVLKADLFTGKKRDSLLDLVDARPAVLKEVADVINMETSTLGSWQWQPSSIPARLRRQLNGKYRVYMDPEIHQALLVHWIGALFSVHLKTGFTSFFHSGAWTHSQPVHMSPKDKARRAYYVGQFATGSRKGSSVRNLRRQKFQEDFFVTQLPSTVAEGNRDYGNDSASDEDMNEGKTPVEVKQSLLHVATTEMLLQKKLYGKFTLVQTDFKWFGPSLPHSTIFAVLRFFEVPEYWISFFQKFLSMSLVFPDDGSDAPARERKCGVPISHALSDGLGEAVLFCLDFAVNKATHGSVQLYRFHDDVWYWGQEDKCVAAWKTIKSLSDVLGLTINDEKTGSISIVGNSVKDKPAAGLPTGQVKWGFLVFDPTEGRWTINMDSINEHIVELRRQLVACQSVLAEIQVWNSYVSRFFSNNFGQATNCMGRQHLDMVFAAFEKIQRDLFTSLGRADGCRDITSYLKQRISVRFDVNDIPDSFLAFPIEYGGLDVRSPFIPLLAIYDKSIKNPSSCLDEAYEIDEEDYEEAKQRFESAERSKRYGDIPDGCDAKSFMTLEEYVRFREETSLPLVEAYEKLLEMPAEREAELTHTVKAALEGIPSDLKTSKNINGRWYSMETYWKWVTQLYAKEAMSKFGGMVLGERDMLPVELVKLLRSEKVRLQG